MIITPMILADDYANKDYNFLNIKTTLDNNVNGGWDKIIPYVYLGGTSRSTKIDYTKDLFMPVESWEYEVCERGLSTQLASDDGSGVSTNSRSTYGIYSDTSTVIAYARIPSNLSESRLYEITWYFQPKDKDKYYVVDLVGTSGTKSIQAKLNAPANGGSSGYVAFYSNDTYTKAVMTYDSIAHDYRIINVSDTNR